MGYWDATDQILNSGGAPRCPTCGKTMYPADDHGRFVCGCSGLSFFDAVAGVRLETPRIPQIPEGTQLTDAEKEEIPPMNRLHLPPTEREKKALEELRRLHRIEMEGDK